MLIESEEWQLENDYRKERKCQMLFIMTKDKVTKHKKVRYADGNGHNIYFTPEEVVDLDDSEAIKVTVEPEKL